MSRYISLNSHTQLEQTITNDLRSSLEKRGFTVIHNGAGDHHAPGGKPDIVAFDDKHVLIFEVTKSKSAGHKYPTMDFMSIFEQYSSFTDDLHVSNLLVEYVFPNDEDIHKIMMGRDSENEAVQLGNLGALMDQVIQRKNDLSDFDIKLRSLFDLLTDRAMQTWGNLAKSEGLSMTQIYALQELYYRGSCNMSRIGELLEISVAATSQLAEQLVRSGMVERIENPENRRKKQLKLLLKGTALVEEGIKRQRNCMEEFEQSLSKEEYEQVVEMFKILTDAAQRIR